jgi:hypothetical protein
MDVEGGLCIGVWSDQDSPAIRKALRILHWHRHPIRYLDSTGGGIPLRYKNRPRHVRGEPTPLAVLAAMERQIDEEPWERREVMLAEMGWTPEGVPWARLPFPPFSRC